MATGVYFNIPAYGHTNPTLPLVKELVGRGERIVYFHSTAFRREIEAAGAEFRECVVSEHLGKAADQSNLVKLIGNFFRLGNTVLEVTIDIIERNLEAVKKVKPDYILHDGLCLWGKYIAKALGVKAVSVISSFVFNDRIFKLMPEFFVAYPLMLLCDIKSYLKGFKLSAEIRNKFGLDAEMLNIFCNSEALNIVFTTRYFQPYSSVLDESFRFVGPSVGERREGSDFPFHKLEGRKVVYISLGTVVNNQLDFYKECIRAFGGRDFAVVMPVGNLLDIKDLGDIPGNFIIRNYVPQLKILEKADFFISHCGMNSVNESLYYGVPMIMVPQQIEEEIVAKRVSQLGGGVILKKSRANSENLRCAAEKINSNGSYRSNAAKIGKTFRDAGGYKRAADEILSYTAE